MPKLLLLHRVSCIVRVEENKSKKDPPNFFNIISKVLTAKRVFVLQRGGDVLVRAAAAAVVAVDWRDLLKSSCPRRRRRSVLPLQTKL